MFGVLRTLLGIQAVSAQVSRVRHEARIAAMRIVFTIIAVLLAIVALGFLTAAGYVSLSRELGVVSALLVTGGVYVALALIVWLIGSLSSRRPRPAPETTDIAAATQTALYGIGQSVGDAARKIDPQALATAGGRKLARTVGPLPLAGIAIVVGYLLARRMDR